MPVKQKEVKAEDLAKLATNSKTNDINKKVKVPPKTQAEIDRLDAVYQEAMAEENANAYAVLGIAGPENPDPASYTSTVTPVEASEEAEKAEPEQEKFARSTIQDFDGRTIKIWKDKKEIIVELAPPQLCHQIVLANMFSHVTQLSMKTNREEALAKAMQYVRKVGNHQLPGVCATWQDVVNLCQELGPLGVNAVVNCWLETWPDLGGVYWSDVKK